MLNSNNLIISDCKPCRVHTWILSTSKQNNGVNKNTLLETSKFICYIKSYNLYIETCDHHLTIDDTDNGSMKDGRKETGRLKNAYTINVKCI